MQYRKLAAVAGSALMAGMSLAAPVLATSVTKLSSIGTMASVTGSTTNFPVFVIGANAASSDVAGAVNVAVNLASNVKTSTSISTPGATPGVSGGFALDSADTKLYLTDDTNKVKTILTSTELPAFLASGSVENTAGTKYEYAQYLNIGAKALEYDQPDASNAVKDPAYMVKLGTTVSDSAYLVQGWISFTKPFNATAAIGEEMTLFGKTFTISSETTATELVLFGLAGKETVTAGESKTITVGSNSYDVEVVGISATNAVLSVNGIQKQVVAGSTYDFGGTSVYVSDVFYYEVPAKSGSVVMSIGSDRYVLKDGDAVKRGSDGNEESVKGTIVDWGTGSPAALSDLKIAFDAYSATPHVDYIKAGSTWTDPIFGIKVSYNGPAASNAQEVTIAPGAADYYTVSFEDKYGKTGTVAWAYDATTTTEAGTTLADSSNNKIHVVEGADAAVNEYVFVSGTFPHMLQITDIEEEVSVTYKDVFSGTEYEVTGNATGTAIIDGQSYTVTFDANSAVLTDSTSGTVLFPTLETKYGAKVAFTNNTALAYEVVEDAAAKQYVLPTGSIYFMDNTTALYRSLDNSTWTIVAAGSNDVNVNVTVGRVEYTFNVDSTAAGNSLINSAKIKATEFPTLVVIEEETKAGAIDASIYYAKVDESDDRMELYTPTFTNEAANVQASNTASTTVTNTVTEWGTKVVYDSTAAGIATITYPDTQVVHSVAVGDNPVWSTGAAGGSTTTDVVVPITADVVKLDSEVAAADMSNSDMVLVGGPCVNSLVAQLAANGKFAYACDTWPGSDFGRVQVIADAFATGKTALVIAGTTAAQTDLAAQAVQKGFPGATTAQKDGAMLDIRGSVSSPAYS